jgi:uncharacterized protein YndB with AHSA1/START domain
MTTYQRSTTVACPPEKTFAYVSDIANHADWSTHRLEVQKTSEGPIAAGTTYASTGHLLGTHRAEVKITELVPNQKVVYEAQDDTGHFRHHFTVAAENGGTRLTKGVEVMKAGFLLTLLTPFRGMIIPRNMAADLNRIKEKLEA